MRTEAELRRLMVSRAEPGGQGEAAIAAVLKRLKEHGYLNDQSFAETYARLRQENDKLGQRRVRQDLQQKGIRADLIAETLEARYGNTSEEALAREYLDRKRIARPDSPKDTARVVRRLVTAGFSTGIIYKILRQWNVPDEELVALEELEADETGSSG
jgi:regulatory protein